MENAENSFYFFFPFLFLSIKWSLSCGVHLIFALYVYKCGMHLFLPRLFIVLGLYFEHSL